MWGSADRLLDVGDPDQGQDRRLAATGPASGQVTRRGTLARGRRRSGPQRAPWLHTIGGRACPQRQRGRRDEDRARFHDRRAGRLWRDRVPHDLVRDPQSRGKIVFRLDDCEVPAAWSQVAADVIAQKYFRKAGVPSETKAVREKGVPEFLWRSVPADGASFGGETSARQVFDRLAGAWTYWGWKGGYFTAEADARAYYDEMRHMLARQMAAPNSPQWFNTGPALGLWHRRTGAGPPLCRLQVRQADPVRVGLRASAAACLLHPVGAGRPGQRGRHHGPLGPRGAALQVRLGHRHELFLAPRRGREAVGRWQVVRPHGLSEDRRPGSRRDQIGRDNPSGSEDGDRGRRSPGHRTVHRLEGAGRAESRVDRRGIEDARAEAQRHLRRDQGLGRRPGRRRRPRQESGIEDRHARGEKGLDPGHLTSSACWTMRARATPRSSSPTYDTDWDSEAYDSGLGPELEQLDPRHRRVPAGRRERRRLAAARPCHRRGHRRR